MPEDKKGLSWKAVMAVASATAVVTLLASIGANCLGQGWQDFPEWLEAIATAGALLAASVAAVLAARAFSLERTREDRYRQDALEREAKEQRAQADLVAGWFENRQSPHVAITNRSTLPLYDVEITLFADDKVFTYRRMAVLPPTDVQGVVVHPDQRPPFLNWVRDNRGKDVLVQLRFRDNGQRTWRRDAHTGALTPDVRVDFSGTGGFSAVV